LNDVRSRPRVTVSAVKARLLSVLAGLVLAAFGAGGLLSGGVAPATGATAEPACGAATPRVVDAIDDRVAHEIFDQELMSSEVTADLAHITSSTALSAAVASGDQAQIRAATHAIVYTPVWHIVRLRVLSTSGQLLADVGGPYILAPVSGQISYQGSVVGSFVMSVQDDRGYEKLVSRIVGVPIEEYLHGKPLMGTLKSPPPNPPVSGPLTLGGTNYSVDAYSLSAYPSGSLQIAVFVPTPTAPLDAMSCQQVRLETNAGVVDNIAIGLTLSGHYIYANQRLFVSQAYGYVHLPVFIFKGAHEAYGTDRLAGAGAPAPGHLPKSGDVSYNGSTWLVAAIRPYPPDWIYVLEPASGSASAGRIGPTSGTGDSQ